MKRARRWLGRYWPVLVWLAIPVAAGAASTGLVPCGDGTPGTYMLATSCDLCDFGQLIQNLINFLIILAVPISAILFCVSGWKFVTAGGNVAKATQAKRIFSSAVIGFIICLASWLIVQTILQGVMGNGITSFYAQIGGSWNHLDCINHENPDARPRHNQLSNWLSFNPSTNTVQPVGKNVDSFNGFLGTCQDTNTNCARQVLQAQNINANAANALSCIEMTESSANPQAQSKSSSACGLFQVIRGTWNSVGHSAGCADFSSSCTNAGCNIETAANLFKKSGYSSWTCANCNNRAQQCVNQYDGPAQQL